MGSLSQLKCHACEGLEDKLSKKQIKQNIKQIKNWRINKNCIKKSLKFKDFKSALSFVNKVGKLAEKEGHHPDILLSWGRVEITLFTHSLNGLSINDFILAAKINALLRKKRKKGSL